MNPYKMIAPILLVYIISTNLFGQAAPAFRLLGYVNYQGEVLYNKHGTNPTFADWNSDGKKDLVVGFHFEGRIYVYTNTGEILPTFDDPLSTLSIDGNLIRFAEFT